MGDMSYTLHSLHLNNEPITVRAEFPTPELRNRDDWTEFFESLAELQKRGDLAVGNIDQEIPQGSYCGSTEVSVGFIVPVDLQAWDRVFLQLSNGEPLMVVRNCIPVWRAEAAHRVTINFDNVMVNEELRRRLLGGWRG